MDLTELFGEGWCVTLAAGSAAEVLGVMGVVGPGPVAGGLDEATERLVNGTGPGVLLVARQVASGWTVVVELEGSTGWVGMDPGVLGALSSGGRTAVSACEDPDEITVQVAHDGRLLGGVDAVSGRRSGEDLGAAGRALTAVGFPPPGVDEPTGEAAGAGPSGRAVLALRTVTGVVFDEDVFDGPWTGGVSTAGG
ncbi:DUF6461 domain-containing protein [Streptomyces sp. NPDC002644]